MIKGLHTGVVHEEPMASRSKRGTSAEAEEVRER